MAVRTLESKCDIELSCSEDCIEIIETITKNVQTLAQCNKMITDIADYLNGVSPRWGMCLNQVLPQLYASMCNWKKDYEDIYSFWLATRFVKRLEADSPYVLIKYDILQVFIVCLCIAEKIHNDDCMLLIHYCVIWGQNKAAYPLLCKKILKPLEIEIMSNLWEHLYDNDDIYKRDLALGIVSDVTTKKRKILPAFLSVVTQGNCNQGNCNQHKRKKRKRVRKVKELKEVKKVKKVHRTRKSRNKH